MRFTAFTLLCAVAAAMPTTLPARQLPGGSTDALGLDSVVNTVEKTGLLSGLNLKSKRQLEKVTNLVGGLGGLVGDSSLGGLGSVLKRDAEDLEKRQLDDVEGTVDNLGVLPKGELKTLLKGLNL